MTRDEAFLDEFTKLAVTHGFLMKHLENAYKKVFGPGIDAKATIMKYMPGIRGRMGESLDRGPRWKIENARLVDSGKGYARRGFARAIELLKHTIERRAAK